MADKIEEGSVFEMSDEEHSNIADSVFEYPGPNETEVVETDTGEVLPQDVADEPEEDGGDEVLPETPEEEESDEEDDSADEEEEAGEESTESEKAKTEPASEPEALAPLKAHGKLINVNSIEELRKLAQMGVDYTKKMQRLAPNLKMIKMLEKEGLLDEAKLSHLIDLDKKNPQAIGHLLKESGIDPLEIDTEQAANYKPNNYAVSNEAMALDNVLSDLESSSAFQTTIDVVAKQWDENSKQVVLKNPEILRDINSHIEVGIYEMVAGEVERQKMLGHIGQGVSDLEAYKTVGDLMHKAGAFQGKQASAPQAQAPAPQQPPETDKKRAAALTKGKKAKVKKPNYSPLEMSDEEFAKIANMNF